MVPANVKVIAQRISLLFAAYFVCRLFFLLWNRDLYAQAPADQIFYAFVYGLRFDLAAILFTNAVVLPFWLLPGRWLAKQHFRSIRLITSDWHMRRARYEFGKVLKGKYVVVPDAVRTEPSFFTLFGEYNKYLLRRVAVWADI